MRPKIHYYGWDQEPVDERPSEFFSTGFSSRSGFHPQFDPSHRRKAPRRIGVKTVAVFTLLLLILGAWAMQRYAPMVGPALSRWVGR